MEKLTSINLKSIAEKLNELIELSVDNSKRLDNSELVNRIRALEEKPQYQYDDREVFKRIEALEGLPQYRYDDKALKERVAALENKPQYTYDDGEVFKRIKALENKPAPKQKDFDDSAIMLAIIEIRESLASLDKRIDFIRRTYSEKWQQAEFARTKFQNEVNEQITAIGTPQEIDLSGVEQRIGKLESVKYVNYDDSQIKERITVLEGKLPPKKEDFDKINESLGSLDNRIDFIRRTYGEKWQKSEFERAKFQQSIDKKIAEIETPKEVDLSDIERRLSALESAEHIEYDDSQIKQAIETVKKSMPAKYDDKPIKKSISDIKKSIPQPVNLDGIDSRLKKLESKPNYFYNDKPVLKQIDSIKKELDDVRKSFNGIFE